jgi:endogenous inhibitor of DNA gyrase (YacG/DUF329 family)
MHRFLHGQRCEEHAALRRLPWPGRGRPVIPRHPRLTLETLPLVTVRVGPCAEVCKAKDVGRWALRIHPGSINHQPSEAQDTHLSTHQHQHQHTCKLRRAKCQLRTTVTGRLLGRTFARRLLGLTSQRSSWPALHKRKKIWGGRRAAGRTVRRYHGTPFCSNCCRPLLFARLESREWGAYEGSELDRTCA